MSPKRLDLDVDYIVEEYRGGRSIADIADELGVGETTIKRRLKERDVSTRSKPRKITFSDEITEKIIETYKDGIGCAAIPSKLGLDCSPRPIKRILRENGVELRGRSEQQKARMDRASQDEIDKLTEAAHEAAKGREKTFSERIKMAQSREKNRPDHFVSEQERKVMESLEKRGVGFVHQQAIGPYNPDFGIGPVAVEVYAGNWHWHGAHHGRAEERFRYIMNCGWNIYCIVLDFSVMTGEGFEKRFSFTPSVTDCLLSYVDSARSNPPAPREYRVVWGADEFSTGGSLDDDNISIEPPFTYVSDSG